MHGQRVAASGGSEGPKGVRGVQGARRVAMHGQRAAAPACMKAAASNLALQLLQMMCTPQVIQWVTKHHAASCNM